MAPLDYFPKGASMRRHATSRLLVCAAMAGSAFAAIAVPGAIAGAAPLTLTCTTLTGNAVSQTVSGCTGTGAIAADAGTPPAHGVQTTSTKTVKWSNGKTSIIKYTYGTVTPNACPAVTAYTKFLEVTEKAGSTVSGGTATGLKGGAVSGKVCIYKKTATPTVELVKNLGVLKI